VSDGNIRYENYTGNAGMTKGGTGDVLSGLIGGLLAKNDKMVAGEAGVYINGLAGDRLYEKKSTFYNAEDLIEEIGKVWQEKIKL
jgi:NAD(P)H-hydrate epimerase